MGLQLQSRVKGKGETTAQLAQAIRKLTRQAYPRVSLDVVEALAVDHFIDALSEVQIRLRLREVGPSTLAESEKQSEWRQIFPQRSRELGLWVKSNKVIEKGCHKIKTQNSKWKI